jgi:hypothetical protein
LLSHLDSLLAYASRVTIIIYEEAIIPPIARFCFCTASFLPVHYSWQLIASLPKAPSAFFAVSVVLVVSVFAGAVIKVVVALTTTGTVGLVRAGVIVMAPIDHAVSTGIEFPSQWTLGDAFAVAQVESYVALAIIDRVVAFSVRHALRVGRTNEVGIAPVVDTVAAAIEFFPERAHGDTLSIFEDRASLARFAVILSD